MNRSKIISTTYRKLTTKSLLSTRSASSHSLISQVIHNNHKSSHSLHSTFSLKSFTSHFLNTHHKLYFSSRPSSILDLVLDQDCWSDELEHELEKHEKESWMNHGSVMYILKRLDKDPEKAYAFFNWVTEKSGFKPSSTLFSIMLRVLGNHKECKKQFWITLRKMKEQGFYFDEETYRTILGVFKNEKLASDAAALTHFYDRMLQENAMDGVVKKMVSLVLNVESSNEVENELEEFKEFVSDNFVLRALKELRGHPLKALSIFHWFGKIPGYEHNSVTYNAMSRVLGRNDSITEFWDIVKEMNDAGHEMDIDTYVKVSRQFQKWKSLEDAVKLYECMMDGPYQPSEQDCSVLLRTISIGAITNMDLVFRVAKKFEEKGNTLSKAFYDGIHRSLTSLGQFDEGDEMIETMKSKGYEPDNITYSQLVFGLCKHKRFEEACKVLDKMEDCGCIPDIKTWTILIQGHCVANEVEKALMCFAKMIEKNHCEADADLLDVLIKGFLNQNKTGGAYQLLTEMVKKGKLRPWQATYKNMIQKLLGERKFEEALNLLVLMKKQNYPPFPEPFDDYVSKFGSVEDASEYLKALSVKEFPSVSAYLNVFKCFFKEDRQSEAKDLLYKCPLHIRKHEEVCKFFGSATSNKSPA